MSTGSGKKSPMEQGELDTSPEARHSPEIEIELQTDEDTYKETEPELVPTKNTGQEDQPIVISPIERTEDVDDMLDIKPPQAQAAKDKHRYKHKDDKKRTRDREKDKYTEGHKEKYADPYKEKEKHTDPYKEKEKYSSPYKEKEKYTESYKEKEKEKEIRAKPREREKERKSEKVERKEDREAAREREKLRLKELKDKELERENRRREKSRKERERLERLERERHRLERERQIREREHKKKLARQERERQRQVQERADNARRKEQEEKKRNAPSTRQDLEKRRDREKSKRSRGKQRDPSRSPRRKEPRSDKYDERYSSSAARREDKREYVIEAAAGLHEEDVEMVPEEILVHTEEPVHAASPEEGEHSGSDQNYQTESSSDSHSNSQSDSGSEGSTSSSESEADNHNEDAVHYPEKVRSRFDDESEESVSDSYQHYDQEVEEDEEEPPDDMEQDGLYVEDTPPPSPVELKVELPPYLPAIQGCRNVEEFHCLNRIEEGTYGVVYRARDKKSDEIVALKRLKMEKEKEGFPITSLREINTLLKAQHPNIVKVREIVVGSNMDKIYIVMDYVEHDLKSLMETMKEPFIIGEVKTLMLHLLRGVSHLHDNWIIHRDLKTSNLLFSHKGILKIGDFGLAREYGSPLKHYTPIVVTLWYRAPELLLGTKEYSTAIDLWSVGCIFAELLTRKPLFPGKSEIDELNRIFKELGTPNEKIWPGVGELPAMKKCTFTEYPYNQLRNRFGSLITEKGFDLMNKFLTYNPSRRVTADEGLKHEWFKESPLPVNPSMFPTWPAKSEQPRRSRGNSPKPPSGGKAFSKLLDDENDQIQGFHLGYATKGAAASGPGFSLKFGP